MDWATGRKYGESGPAEYHMECITPHGRHQMVEGPTESSWGISIGRSIVRNARIPSGRITLCIGYLPLMGGGPRVSLGRPGLGGVFGARGGLD